MTTTLTKSESKMTNLKVIDYCDNNKIPYICINIKKNKEGKKDVKGLVSKWIDLDYHELMTKYNNDRLKKPSHYNAISVNLNRGGYVVVDIDNADRKEELLKKYGKEYISHSTTKRLPHIWFKKHEDDKNSTKINIDEGVDLLYHFSFEFIDSAFFYVNDKEIRTYTDFTDAPVPSVKKNTKVKKIKKKVKIEQINDSIEQLCVSPEQKEIIDNISIEYISNYQSWLKIIWALYNSFDNYNICDYVSKRDSKNYKGISDVYKYLKHDKKHLLTFGTICYYSKLSNEANYIQIRSKYNLDNITDDDMGLAQIYLDIVGDDIIYDGSFYYVYKKPYWERLDRNANYLKKNINMELLKVIKSSISLINSNIQDIKNIEDSEFNSLKLKLDKCFKLQKSVNTLSKIKNITECIFIKLENKEYDFDTLQPNYFCFRNCAFDMIKRQKVVIDKYDYITCNTGYDYFEPNESDIETFTNIIKEIEPNQDKYNCLLSVLRLGTIGAQNPYMVYFNGSGSNGKGLLLENVKEVLGTYYTYTNKEFLIQPIKMGANTTLSNLEKKRMVVMSEPEENQKINSSTLKIITDQPVISGRANYETNDRDICLHNISILECNKRPLIRGRHDNSLLRRIVDLEFTQTFTNNEDLLELDGHHKCNSLYKEIGFKHKMRSAFFHIIMNSKYDDIYIPSCVKQRTESYLMGSDDLLSWFNDSYEFVNDKKVEVKVKDVFKKFKESDFYSNLSTTEKRTTWNKKSFIEQIQTNMRLRKYYKSTSSRAHTITNYRENNNSEFDSDDD